MWGLIKIDGRLQSLDLLSVSFKSSIWTSLDNSKGPSFDGFSVSFYYSKNHNEPKRGMITMVGQG